MVLEELQDKIINLAWLLKEFGIRLYKLVERRIGNEKILERNFAVYDYYIDHGAPGDCVYAPV